MACFALLCLLAATAQVALLRSAAAPGPRAPAVQAGRLTFTVMLVAVLPAVGALAALLIGVAAVAPAEFASPDTATPILLRLRAPLVPFLVVSSWRCSAARRSAAQRCAWRRGARRPVTAVAGPSARTLLRQPCARSAWRSAGCCWISCALVVTSALLTRAVGADRRRAGRRAAGDARGAPAAGRLRGDLAGLLLAAGALHVGVSTWWALERARHGRETGRGIAAGGRRAADRNGHWRGGVTQLRAGHPVGAPAALLVPWCWARRSASSASCIASRPGSGPTRWSASARPSSRSSRPTASPGPRRPDPDRRPDRLRHRLHRGRHDPPAPRQRPRPDHGRLALVGGRDRHGGGGRAARRGAGRHAADPGRPVAAR